MPSLITRVKTDFPKCIFDTYSEMCFALSLTVSEMSSYKLTVHANMHLYIYNK
jgi:hypothetical protein